MQFLKPLEVRLRSLRNRLAPLLYPGDRYHCPVCEGNFGRFRPAGTGHRHRENAVCPSCRSRERDRLTWLFISARPELFERPAMRMLHVAPEPCLRGRFQQRVGDGYITIDLMRRDVTLQMDVTDLHFPDGHFDALFCSHVLQDVPDDMRALAEFHRVLKAGGWAIINVPIFTDITIENSAPDKPRTKGDARPDEHLRSYGSDYAERLGAVGFDVTVNGPEEVEAAAAARQRQAIDGTRVGQVHFVRKPSAQNS